MPKSPIDSEPIPSDDFDRFLADASARYAEQERAAFVESERVLWLTEQFKDPASGIVCLSYPDGTLNNDAIRMFESELLMLASAGLSTKEVISNEQDFYYDCLELLRVSSSPIDKRFPVVSAGKKQLIAIWVISRQLPFDSPDVDFLNAILPGEETTEADIDTAVEDLVNQHAEIEEIVCKMSDIIENDNGYASVYHGLTHWQRADLLNDLVEELARKLDSGVYISDGELNYRLQQMQVQCGISEQALHKCLRQLNIVYGYDFNGLTTNPEPLK